MSDNSNPYTIRTENRDDNTRYIVSFHNGQNVYKETEVSAVLAGGLNDFSYKEFAKQMK